MLGARTRTPWRRVPREPLWRTQETMSAQCGLSENRPNHVASMRGEFFELMDGLVGPHPTHRKRQMRGRRGLSRRHRATRCGRPPEFRVAEMLTDKALPLYPHISYACEAGLGPELAANEMLKAGWENNPYVKEFFARNTPGRKPVHGPLLLISGDTVVARLCRQKIACFLSSIRA